MWPAHIPVDRLTAEELNLLRHGWANRVFHRIPKAGTIRVACVGDSITNGFAVENWPENNYPQVLQNFLGENYHVENYGYCSATAQSEGDTPYVDLQVYRDSLAFQPQLVVVKLGTNDTKEHNWAGVARFNQRYEALIRSYLALDSVERLWLCTPASVYHVPEEPAGYYNYHVRGQQLEEISEAVKKLGKRLNLPVLDLHALTAGHPEWFADGIHPNAQGAAEIAETVYRAVIKRA